MKRLLTRARSLRVTLWTLIVPPTTWAVHFLFSYLWAAVSCAKLGQWARFPTAFAIGTVAALMVIVASGLIAWQQSRTPGDPPPHNEGTDIDRLRFLAYATMLLAGLSFVAVLFTAERLPMNRPALFAGLTLVPVGWALSPFGMTGHMAAHMIAVAIAAPLIALGLQGSRYDPAHLLPRLATPLVAALVEAVVVWGWHVPALRRLVAHAPAWLAVEQAMFLAAGLLLWSAVLAPRHRAAGVAALLVTSMHMTLLGALIGLAPRPLYMHHGANALADQQLAGVVMLLVGGIAYLIGGLAMLGRLLQPREGAPA